MTVPSAGTIAPMLARLARELPTGDYLYEPKWDGFRCLGFVAGGDVDLRSRHGRPLATTPSAPVTWDEVERATATGAGVVVRAGGRPAAARPPRRPLREVLEGGHRLPDRLDAGR